MFSFFAVTGCDAKKDATPAATTGADDGDSESVQHGVELFGLAVYAATRLAHASNPLNHTFAIGAIL